MANQKVRARYVTKNLGKQPVTYTKAWMDPDTKSLQMEQVTEDRDCFMVMFPQGHSIRVTSIEELKRMGYDKKPRLVDMETGDVVDVGGDPYDFANDLDVDVVVMEDDEKDDKPSRSKAAKEPS
jgi:hypothetical protein